MAEGDEHRAGDGSRATIAAEIQVVHTVPPKIRMHMIEDHQLSLIVNISKPLALAAFGACVGTFFSLLPSAIGSIDKLNTDEFGWSDLLFIVFDTLALVGTFSFGYLSYKGNEDAKRMVADIRSRAEHTWE